METKVSLPKGIDLKQNRSLYQKILSPDFKALIAICVHRAIDPDTFECLLALQRCPNPVFSVHFRHGDALIDRSRSIFATNFLEKDYPMMMFIDDDVIFDPHDVIKVCKSVMEDGLDIVGGAYVKKQRIGTNFAVKLLEPLKGLVFGDDEKAGIYEVRSISTGFMAIHRRVFEKMRDTEQVHLCSGNFYPFFKPQEKMIEGKWVYQSEDWAFTERAKDLGFKVWLDTTVNLKHAGRYVYDNEDIVRKKEDLRSLTYWEENGEHRFRAIK